MSDAASKFIAETRAQRAPDRPDGFHAARYDAHGLPITERLRGSQNPDAFHYCQHGVSTSRVTADGAPACPFCRGITRRLRNVPADL